MTALRRHWVNVFKHNEAVFKNKDINIKELRTLINVAVVIKEGTQREPGSNLEESVE